jgi:hypothetical protein
LVRQIKRNVIVAQNANAPTPIRDALHEPLARDPPAEPVTRAQSWLDKLVPFARFLMIFFMGVTATLAWQSHGRAAREAIAGWLAPQVGPAAPAPFAGASPDQLVAMSRSLAGLRESVDMLAGDITKLQATKQDTPGRTSAPLPTPSPSRAPPVR